MFNNGLLWESEIIRYQNKRLRGFVLRKYNNIGELRRNRNPSWCYSLQTNSWITSITTKRDGVSYIPVENVIKNDFLYLYLHGEMYFIFIKSVNDFQIQAKVRISSKQEYGKDREFLTVDVLEAYNLMGLNGISRKPEKKTGKKDKQVVKDKKDDIQKKADYLREKAEKIVKTSNEVLNASRLTNTVRRARIAASVEGDARRELRFAGILNNIADNIGSLKYLSRISSITQVRTLKDILGYAKILYAREITFKDKSRSWSEIVDRETTREMIEWAKYPLRTNKSEQIELTRLQKMGIENLQQLKEALLEMLPLIGKRIKEDPITKMERELVGKNFTGRDFFPTPPAFAKYLVEKADIKNGDYVLEPSAGKGDIADAVRNAGAEIDVIEIDYDLRPILEAKGYSIIGRDFLEHEVNGKLYDKVIMNPPFSKNQDVKHVRHAFNFLSPGGRLVAIMGEHPFFAEDKKSREFREWLSGLDYTTESHENVFKNSMKSTSARCRVVVIEK